jgi:hypothetical protein
LNLKPKKRLVTLSILLAAILVIAISLTGCVRGMSPIGWAGVAIGNDALYTGSKQGRVVSITLESGDEIVTRDYGYDFRYIWLRRPDQSRGYLRNSALANGLVLYAYNGEVDAYTADT